MALKKVARQKSGTSQDAYAFQRMFESHPAVMLLLEPLSGFIVDANQAAQQFYGYPKARLCEMSFAMLGSVAQPGEVFNPTLTSFNSWHRMGSGEERRVLIQISPFVLHEKALLFAIVQDQSSHKQADDRRAVEFGLLSTLLDHLPDRIYVKDMFGRKIISNAADWQSNAKSLQDVLGKSDFDTYSPELAAKFWADDQSVLTSGIPVVNREEPGLDSQGNRVWVLTTKVPLRDDSGRLTGLVGIGRDITERKQVEDELEKSKQIFHLLIENLPQNIYAKDLDGRFIFANQHYCAVQGKRLDEIVGKTDYDLHSRDLAEKYRADDRRLLETGEVLEQEEEHEPIGGKRIFVQVIKTPFYDSAGHAAGTLGIFWDISDRKCTEIASQIAREKLEHAHHNLQESFAHEHRLSHLDELTGLNNRRSLMEYAEHEFNIAIRYKSNLSIMMIDIDDFKHINDNFGHLIGDLMLENLAQMVCSEMRATDIVGRFGGDEFVVLLPHTGALEALQLAERVQASLAGAPLNTKQGLLHITLSIGVAQTLNFDHQDTLKMLIQHADEALYSAKQAGKNQIQIFELHKKRV